MKGALLCTTISAPDCSGMAEKAALALSMGSDLVELRIDHLSAPRKDEVIEVLSDIFPKAVVTVRPSSEGGRFDGNETQRLELLNGLASLRPAFVDVELAAAERAPELVRSLAATTIVSWHDFTGTPSVRKLSDRAKAAARHGDLAKIVTTASKPEDVDSVLSLYSTIGRGRLIAFCMGDPGGRSRIEAVRLGSPLTYCTLNSEPVAPGQIPLAEMQNLLRSFGR